MKYRHLTILLAVGSILFTACGSSRAASSPSATPTSTTSDRSTKAPSTGSLNAAEIVFAQSMIPHHQQAVEMANMALDAAAHAGDNVRALATGIKAAQDPEIKTMQGWLKTAGQPKTMDTAMGGMDGGSAMPGMMSSAEMSGLKALQGAKFDKMWLNMMIRHHQGAITMAETVTTGGSNADVLGLAAKIIVAQQSEIDKMKILLPG